MRKSLLVVPVLLTASLVAACSSSSTSSETSAAASAAASSAASADATMAADDTMCGTTVDEIAAKAKEEGNVNLIALPDTWANYGGILKSFRDTYGLEAPVANPDASSADELTAITTLAGQPDKPDSIDIGPSFTAQAMADGLIEPYKTDQLGRDPRRSQGR